VYLLRHLHTYHALPKFLGASAREECGDLTLRKTDGCAGEQGTELSQRTATEAWQPACWSGHLLVNMVVLWPGGCHQGGAEGHLMEKRR